MVLTEYRRQTDVQIYTDSALTAVTAHRVRVVGRLAAVIEPATVTLVVEMIGTGGDPESICKNSKHDVSFPFWI